MEIHIGEKVYRFASVQEARDWEGSVETPRLRLVKARKPYANRSYGEWKEVEVKDIVALIMGGVKTSKIPKHAIVARQGHSKVAVGVMASRAKAIMGGKNLPRFRKEVRNWILEEANK